MKNLSNKIFPLYLIIFSLIPLACKNKSNRLEKIHAFEVINNKNTLIDTILNYAEFKTFVVYYNNQDSILSIIPVSTSCIPNNGNKIHFIKKKDAIIVFNSLSTVKKIFRQVKIKNVKIDRCKVSKKNIKSGDTPIMLFKYKNEKFINEKGFYW